MEEPPSTEEELVLKHKKERKTLQAEIQKIKHAVPKGDKKRKKDAQVQVAQLEADMDARHKAELDAFTPGASGAEATADKEVDDVTEKLDGLGTGDTEESAEHHKQKKVSKAQKRRDKKDQQAKERDDRIREQEIINIQGPRNQESRKLKKKLQEKDLAVFEVPSDGNCLYAALVHQLERRDLQTSVESLRKQCADHMDDQSGDFLPFLTTESGNPFTEEQFEKYLGDLANTAAWGGQLELKALANVLRVPIEVLQAESPSILLGQEFDGEAPLVVTYHRHMFGLGEHYNSVIPISEVVEEEEELT